MISYYYGILIMIPNIIVHANAGLRKIVANGSEHHSLVIIIFVAVIL